MKKLLITASTFPRWENDTEPRFILDYAKAMQRFFDVTVLVPATPGALSKEILEGVNVVRYHYFPIHRLETLCYPGAIVPRIKEKKIRVLLVPFLFVSLFLHELKIINYFDIVHAHWLIPQGLVQGFFKKPYIVTGHGGDVTSINNGVIRRLKKYCLEKAIGVTVVSRHLKNVVKNISASVDPRIIPMGIDISKFGSQYRVNQYFQQNDSIVILFVGRLEEKKGVRYLIDAMQYVADAKLIIVGEGTLKKELESLASPYGSRIQFWGAKNHEELKTIYASADVFCAPSITADDGDQEGFGLVILEAMASGLCVIASNSGGIGQIVENEVTGLLCEEKNSLQIANAINRISSDNQLRGKLLRNTKELIAQYDYSNIAYSYYRMIEELT